MGVQHVDKRVIKTKRGLREAFIRLLFEKGYDAISIKDIADEAEAARVTFYRHYKNKEELLIDCIDEIFDDLAKKIKQQSGGGFQQGGSPMVAYYQQLQTDGQIYRILSKSQAGHLLMKRLIDLYANQFVAQIDARFPEQKRLVPADIVAYHMASALVGITNWWIEHDQPYSPEYMARVSFWLSVAGSARGLGLEEIPVVPPDIPMTAEDEEDRSNSTP